MICKYTLSAMKFRFLSSSLVLSTATGFGGGLTHALRPGAPRRCVEREAGSSRKIPVWTPCPPGSAPRCPQYCAASSSPRTRPRNADMSPRVPCSCKTGNKTNADWRGGEGWKGAAERPRQLVTSGGDQHIGPGIM